MKIIKSILKSFFDLPILRSIPLVRACRETQNTMTRVTLSKWFFQRVLRINARVPWPVHFTSQVLNSERIEIGVETSPGYMPGCYIQGLGGVKIGDYTQIGPQVGIVGANHGFYDNRVDDTRDGIVIGSYCWLGMGVIILPGVKLGDFTVVAAGSVVTKSFPEGYQVLGGVPAVGLKNLDKSLCVRHKSKYEYCGYLPLSTYLKRYKGCSGL